jgi:hypothetical protein
LSQSDDGWRVRAEFARATHVSVARSASGDKLESFVGERFNFEIVDFVHANFFHTVSPLLVDFSAGRSQSDRRLVRAISARATHVAVARPSARDELESFVGKRLDLEIVDSGKPGVFHGDPPFLVISALRLLAV